MIARRIGEQEGQLLRALQALNRSREDVKELQTRRARFMMTAAHQLKSPLAAIQTMATLVHDGYVEGHEANSTVARIIRRSQEAITHLEEAVRCDQEIHDAPTDWEPFYWLAFAGRAREESQAPVDVSVFIGGFRHDLSTAFDSTPFFGIR